MAQGKFGNSDGLEDLNSEDIGTFVSGKDVGGYTLDNILSPTRFMSKNKNVTLSFLLHDITIVDGDEIMKLILTKIPHIIIRIMKYTNTAGFPTAIFDIIDIKSKKILLESNKEFVGGLGMDTYFYNGGIITQWEIPIFTKLCRAFVFGDIETIVMLHNEYHLKFDENNESRLKNILGIK